MLAVLGILLSIELFNELIVINAVTTTITLAGITPLDHLNVMLYCLLNRNVFNVPAHKESYPRKVNQEYQGKKEFTDIVSEWAI